MPFVSLAQRMRRLLRRWLAPGVCLALLWLLGAVLPAHAARLALVIGNDQYTSIERLKNARNDAKLISGVLKQAGFEVTLVNDQSRQQFWKTIDSFKGRINKGDEVVFYFAGHGVQIGANQLLLPTDIKGQSEAEVQRDGVPLVEVQDALKDARVAVLLIDACRDNPFPKQGTRSLGGTRGLSPPEPSTGQIIMLSAGRNQKALDSVPGQSIGNGLFTWELAQLIQTPGLEIRQALEQVKDRVDDKARKANHQQRPSVVSDLRGNFFFIDPGANVTIQVSPTTTLAPTARPVSADPDTALWYAVEAGGTADDYGVYVKQYPKGKFVALAKQRLQKLQDEAARAASAAEEAAWQSAESGGTEAGYQSYLASYPQGLYAALAQSRMNKLKVQAAERERLAAEQRQREQAQAAHREEVEAVAELSRLKTAVIAGDAKAMASLGFMYADGRGGLAKDDLKAESWIRKAVLGGDLQAEPWLRQRAQMGNGLAMGLLGYLYSLGLGGLPKDYFQAESWYRKGATIGNAAAMNGLGVVYARGVGGLTKDDVQAVAWYRKAAEAGNVVGMNNLGISIEKAVADW